MAEGRLNFDAPLMSTRRLQTTAVSVRRNKNPMSDDSKTRVCPTVSVCRPDIGLDRDTEPASIPFTWEQSPPRLKDHGLRPEKTDSGHDFDSSKPSVGKVIDILKCPSGKDFEGQIAVGKAIHENKTRLRGPVEEKVPEPEDDDDDVFSDALDTLSPKGSCSEFRSVTAVSGYGTETKKPTRVSEDPQSREFMLNRFLPAAKAMTLEQPQYAAKKQPLPLMSEPKRLVRETVAVENRPTFNRYESIISQYYQEDVDDNESDEDEGDAYEFADSASMTKRGCGLLPQLCFRNSLGMLNTVPGLKAKANSQITSKEHYQEKTSKVAQFKSRFQFVKKFAMDSVYKQKDGVRAESLKHPSLGNKLNFGSPLHPSFGNKLSSGSPLHPNVGKNPNFGSEQFGLNSATCSRSSSPYRRSGCKSPYRSAGNTAPYRQSGYPGTLKEAESLRANRLNKHIKCANRSQDLLFPRSTRQDCQKSSAAEKTVHVDTENSLETKYRKNSNLSVLPETTESSLSRSETVSEETETAGQSRDANLECSASENPSVSSGKTLKADDLSPLAPPLPKKPSESWLFRNVPSVSSRISSHRAPFHPQKHDLEENTNSLIKWETIVKTSYLHKDHIRYSEELVGRTSHQSKT